MEKQITTTMIQNKDKQVEKLKLQLKDSQEKSKKQEGKIEVLLKANIGLSERIRFLEKELKKRGD